MLRDVSHVDLTTEILGGTYQAPWWVAPTTLQRSVHPDGELAMARTCAAAGSLLVVSSNAGTTFDAIGATGVGWWLQAYLPSDRELAVPLLERAVAAGARRSCSSSTRPWPAARSLPAGDQFSSWCRSDSSG